MSMNRTALRLATVLVLNNNYKEPWPTNAQDRVFDSRNSPPERQYEDQLRPEITVFTTDDEAKDPVGKRDPMRDRNIDLIIECAVCSWGFKEEDNGDLMVSMDCPVTDAQMEAKLDALEAQVRFALANPLNKWATHWGAMVIKMNSWTSGRWAQEVESRTPLAMRVIKINLKIHDDCPPESKIVDGVPALVNKLPAHMQRLVDAIDADVQPGQQPDEYVTDIAQILRSSGIPSEITQRPLKSLKMTTGQPVGTKQLDVDVDFNDQI